MSARRKRRKRDKRANRTHEKIQRRSSLKVPCVLIQITQPGTAGSLKFGHRNSPKLRRAVCYKNVLFDRLDFRNPLPGDRGRQWPARRNKDIMESAKNMSKERTYQREEFILSYDGPAIREHEMDVEILAASLLSFRSLVDRTNTALNGKNVQACVKVKAGFEAGSLTAKMVVEYVGMVLPIFPQAVQTIRELISLRYFLNGQPPQKVEDTGNGNMNITNSEGSTQIFHAPVYNINGNATIISDLGKTLAPLNSGVDQVKLITPGKNGGTPEVTIASKDKKDLLIPAVDDEVEEENVSCVLEVVTPNFDGSPKGWRFYDPEEDVTFSATVVDSFFLENVVAGGRSFKAGDMVKVEMRVVRKTVTKRKHTDRIIVSVQELAEEENEN